MRPDPDSANAIVAWRHLELAVQDYFLRTEGLALSRPLSLPIGYRDGGKNHRYDLGSVERKIVIECKCLTWTRTGGVPVAKFQGANEALLYLSLAPKAYRKILIFQKMIYNGKNLAKRYFKMHGHLFAPDIQLMEFGLDTGETASLTSAQTA